MASLPKIIVVLGPTASGKSDLAVKIAKRFRGEVISADSRQVYRGMDIGTGKIPRDPHPPKSYILNSKSSSSPRFSLLASRFFHQGVPHHLLDVVSPKRTFTVARYQKLATKAIRDVFSRGHLPVIAGGTGLYIDSLIYQTRLPNVPPSAALRRKLEKYSATELFMRLKKLDPRRAKNIDRHNKRRLVRALEIVLAMGKPVPSLGDKKSPYKVMKIGIFPGTRMLKKRIRKRLLARLRAGMVAEVKKLHDNGVDWQRLDNFGLEYRYVSRYLRGIITKKEMVAKLEKETWQYARRQMTWFRRDKEIIWTESAGNKRILGKVKSFLRA